MIKVRVFDYEHEKDLEKEVNDFLREITEQQLIDIQFDVAATSTCEDNEQVYCFSAMVVYRS